MRHLRVRGHGLEAAAVFTDARPLSEARAVPGETSPELRWFRDLPWRLIRPELVRRRLAWEWL
jgi:hypothetical protein